MTPITPQHFVTRSPALAAALVHENISFSTYAMMIAVHTAEQPPSLAAVSCMIGSSYWAARHRIDRTPYFIKSHQDLVRLSLTPEAITKLERIEKLLARHERFTI